MNLLNDVKELNTFFEQTKTYDTATTFDLFKTGLLQACNGIADREATSPKTSNYECK